MKIRSIAFAAAALVAAQAHAITLPAGTKTLYVSGSSALTPVIKGIFATNCASAVNTYADATGKEQWLFTCTVNNTSKLGQKLGLTAASPATTIALFKRDSGGSAMGVTPVATGSAIAFLDEASLTTTGANAGATTKNVVPQLGASDVEPALLQEPLNLPAGVAAVPPATLANLVVSPALLQTFGIAVNNNLYQAMQTAQGLSGSQVPSISSNFIKSLVNQGGVFQSAVKTWGYMLGNSNIGQVNVCRRGPGSGTQAGANLLFSPYNETPVNTFDGDSGAATTIGSTGILYVNEASSTGGVKTCLNAADATNDPDTYAIGYVGYENKPSGSDTWKFVKLDGYMADVANAAAGLYQYAYENTYQYKSTLAGTGLQFAKAIIEESQDPAVIATLSADLQSSAIPVTESPAKRGGNSRNPLKVVE